MSDLVRRQLPSPRALSRAALADGGRGVAAPVRIVHLGLGAFTRAHQAWYTSVADSENEWGIAAFTGRSASSAATLAAQDGLFHVIERSATGDTARLITSIVEAVDGERTDRLQVLLAAPTTAILTLTITEPGYRLRDDATPDTDDPDVVRDIQLLRRVLGAAGTDAAAGPKTALGRLLLGLAARRRADSGPLAIVPCDNIAANGPFVGTGVLALATAVHPDTAEWIDGNVSFISTCVDRITPRTTAADLTRVTELTGWRDDAPVVTEPYHDWILSGAFPAGRPAWERAGARFVDDIAPFERRKLWLLNGAHSLLAYAGLRRGHVTVADAILDPACRDQVLRLWEEARTHLPFERLELDTYLAALLERLENPRIEHRLEQISAEAVTKLRVRLVPVAHLERSAGRRAEGAAAAMGAWVALVRSGRVLVDARWSEVAAASSDSDPTRALLALLDPALAADEQFVDAVGGRRS